MAINANGSAQPHVVTGHQLISIGIVTYKSDSALLDGTLRALCAARREVLTVEKTESCVQVVVNDPQPARYADVERLVENTNAAFPDLLPIEILKTEKNIGYGAGQNRAMLHSDGDYCLILNPDVEMCTSALVESVRFLKRNPATAMVVPQGYDVGGNYARLAKRYPSLLVLALRWLAVGPSKLTIGRYVSNYVYDDVLPSSTPTSVCLASGCFMFCRGQVWREEGGFDERYYLYFEDYDLSLRVGRRGEIVELPGVEVVHHGGGTARFNLRRLMLFLSSAFKFFRKNEWKWI